MKRNGFTLIELLVVIGISAILLTVATLNFSTWTRKSNIEAQIRQLYADLMTVRSQAMGGNKYRFVVLGSNQYTVYDDTNGNESYDAGTDAQLSQKSLRYAMTWKDTAYPEIDFTSRGIASYYSSQTAGYEKTICVFSNVNPAVDCIKVLPTRITMGKISNQGGACDLNNCQAR